MALGQVGARTEGDVYQGRFFWRQAADLLRPTSLVDALEAAKLTLQAGNVDARHGFHPSTVAIDFNALFP